MCNCKSKPQQRTTSQVQKPIQRPLINKGGNRRVIIRQK